MIVGNQGRTRHRYQTKSWGGGRSPGLLPREHVSDVVLSSAQFSIGHLKGAYPMQTPFGFPEGIEPIETEGSLIRCMTTKKEHALEEIS